MQIPCALFEPDGKLLNIQSFDRKIPRGILIYFNNGIVNGTKLTLFVRIITSDAGRRIGSQIVIVYGI